MMQDACTCPWLSTAGSKIEFHLEPALGVGSAREQDGARQEAVSQASRSNWQGECL